MRSKKVLGIAFGLLVVFLAAFMMFTVNAQDVTEDEPVLLFVGTVTGIEDEFVGVAIDGEDVTLYICDGQPELGTVSIAQWFIGTVTDNALDITAPNGNRVEAVIDGDTVTGHFTFTDGTTKDFVLTSAEGIAALYRSEFTLGETDFVGGWLVLEDGTTRGAVFNTDTAELVPATLVGGPAIDSDEEDAEG